MLFSVNRWRGHRLSPTFLAKSCNVSIIEISVSILEPEVSILET